MPHLTSAAPSRVNPTPSDSTLPPPERRPRHIAVIMDGNGRWAQQRGEPRIAGHQAGARSVREIVTESGRLGLEVLTLYSFSIENWKRPEDEVGALMQLAGEYLVREREELIRNNVRFRQIGRRQGLPAHVIEGINACEAATAHCTGLTLCLAMNYGARAEIVDAVRAIAERIRSGEITPEAIDENMIGAHLDTRGLRDPDLLIRTAGEYRLSNYLLWQSSYAELFVTPVLWPDFTASVLHEAIRSYAARDRRFGGLSTPPT